MEIPDGRESRVREIERNRGEAVGGRAQKKSTAGSPVISSNVSWQSNCAASTAT